MSTDQPGPGSPDDPFAKRPGDGGGPPSGDGAYGGPHGAPPPGGPHADGEGGQGGGPFGQSPHDRDPYGPGPYGEGPRDQGPYDRGPYGRNPSADGPPGPGQRPGPDPLAGMPPLAGRGRRVLARIVDVVVVLVPAYLLEWAVIGAQRGDVNVGRSAVGGVFAAVVGFLYEWYLTKATGQTLGKRAMGLRIAMLADGSVPTPTAAAVRAAVLWLPVFCCYCVWFLLIGVTVALDRPYRQGVHDKAARTVVVEVT
ncbi:RDD family protein [Actinacidiphila sp. ITFR-21]|uniref:RDD family protein n=1 Tax=Actinacidiphila sp. ITFR-21 TaxID=3075199 RepID=UPI00288A3F5C|nr:RDD family protein [Streptomyces sp. ITFR-21]WNI15706.1 RDD family protein [Streptomyces sp. ITFR-21]